MQSLAGTSPGLDREATGSRGVLVLGLGNILLQDEGVGVRAVEALYRDYRLCEGVDVLEGGTSGMALLDDIRNRDHVIVVDAVKTGRPPGSVVILVDDEVPAFFQSKVSPHQLALSDLLAVLKLTGEQPASITVVGMEPQSLDIGLELSELIAARVETLVNRVVEQLRLLGIAVEAVSA